jgi:hypothetical protein
MEDAPPLKYLERPFGQALFEKDYCMLGPKRATGSTLSRNKKMREILTQNPANPA